MYDKLGGASGIEKVVIAFYTKVAMDPKMTHLFLGIDLSK
jgi:truncated hemoglobin YjbI